MKSIAAVFIGLLTCSQLAAQSPESLRIMTYNLTYFRSFTSFCTSSNNPPGAKEGWLATVVAHTQPDVLVCNEVDGANSTAHSRILSQCLNTNGVSRWASTDLYTNGSSLINAVYYDQTKLGVKSQSIISNDVQNNPLVRGIDVIRFYYKDSLLAWNPDTVFFTLFAGHFKAGNTATDLTDRQKTAEAIMNYLVTKPRDPHYVLCGDLNMPKSQEAGFQQLLNYSNSTVRFYDPENQLGNWGSNGSFAAMHTQSTRDGQTNSGCFSGGGLDDRYDHILTNQSLLTSAARMRYLPGTLKPIGNDGLHFNAAINAGTNNSVPSNVLTALYELSDHLPVVADFEVDRLGIGTPELAQQAVLTRSESGLVQLRRIALASDWSVSVYDASGRLLERSNWPEGQPLWAPSHSPIGWTLYIVTTPSGSSKFAVPQ